MGTLFQAEEWDMSGHRVFGAKGKSGEHNLCRHQVMLIGANKLYFNVSYKMAVRVWFVRG